MPPNVSLACYRCLRLGFVSHVTHDPKRLTTAMLDVIGTSVSILRLDINTDNPGTSLRHATAMPPQILGLVPVMRALYS